MTLSVAGAGTPIAGAVSSLAVEASDAELIAHLAADDVEALGQLYNRHRAAAFGIALRITRDPSLAEDAVQNAFLSIFRNPHGYQADRGIVRTWLLAIVHNRSIDLLRR